jgi:phage baseplate assembly protein W
MYTTFVINNSLTKEISVATITPATKPEIYSDFQTNFTIHPITKDLTRLVNEEAVKRSIKNILLTNHYERPFRPKFGANIRKYLFENITPITLRSMKSDIQLAIENFEPRANIIDIVVSAASNPNEVDITVTFSTINRLEPVTVSTTLGLERVR